MPEPQQQPTPEKTPRPGVERSNSEVSSTDVDDQGYESRSRSQSRRRRRQNQRQKQAQAKAQSKSQAGNASAQSMASVPEQAEETDDHPGTQVMQRGSEEQDKPQWLQDPDVREITETQPFDRIKPPSQGMMGPVTYARMLRGEIPWRGPPPSQPLETAKAADATNSSGKDPMDQDGLKLRIELNLDIEIELKASIHGDLTLALL